MGITVTPQEKPILSPGRLLDLMSRSPYVMAELQKEETERDAAALQGRLRCLDDLTANGKEIADLQRKAQKQKEAADRAHDAYIEQAAKLGELERRILHLQTHEGRLCCSLSADHGEAALDEWLGKLPSGMAWLAGQIAQLRADTSGSWGRDPESATYADRQKKLGTIKRFTRYHEETKAAYERALELRLARISPSQLAAEVEALVSPLRDHKYEE